MRVLATVDEEWRPVRGYEGSYEVSDQGRVRSLDRLVIDSRGRKRHWPGRLLRPRVPAATPNYPVLEIGGQKARIHVLVLAAFVGPRPVTMKHIRHLNGDPTDCRLTNLAYGTPSENAFDKSAHGRHHNGGKTHCHRGHEFTSENTYIRTDGRHRACRACRNLLYARRVGKK